MSICGIVGDSIALGIALLNPQCHANAVVGRSPATIAFVVPPSEFYKYGIISAGSNDPRNPNMRAQLYRIRQNLNAEKVVWIAPMYDVSRIQVRLVASIFHDKVVYFTPDKDGVHPKSYKTLNKDIEKFLH